MHKIFVYGTLKTGFHNNYLLDGQRLIGPAVTPVGYTIRDIGHFPGLFDSGSGSVGGQVWEVDDETLERLDRLERVPKLYFRDSMTVNMSDGSQAEVQAYFFNGSASKYPIVQNGVWEGKGCAG